jgi:hypothetical protein
VTQIRWALAAALFGLAPVGTYAQQAGLPALQTDLAAEVARAKSEEARLQASAGGEASRAAAAEATLQGALNAEAAARQQGDADALASATAYADGKTAEAVVAAKAYADSKAAGIRGYELKSCGSDSAGGFMVCECPEGKQPLGGGGYCYNMEGGFPPAISQSAPLGANWSIACNQNGPSIGVSVFVICASVE